MQHDTNVNLTNLDENIENSMILSSLYKYVKANYDNNLSISDIILDFCEINGYNEEFIGEIIKLDAQLTDFIKTDCLKRHILKH